MKKEWKMAGKPALLILHMQKGMFDKNPVLRKVLAESGIVSRQQKLLKEFRTKQLPVIYVNVMKHAPIQGIPPSYGFLWEEERSYEHWPGDIEVISELAPLAGEAVLVSWPFTAFNNSGLEQALRILGVNTLVLAGFATNGVVYGTAQAAADRFFSVIVPSDASTSPSELGHKAVIEAMAPAIALVTTTDDVLAHLE